MVTTAASAFFDASGIAPFGVAVSIKGNVPIARGVGFSATVRIGVVAALNALANAGLNHQELLNLGTALEGHPDNVSPALLGGFTVSGKVGETVRCQRFAVHRRLKIVALFPALQLRTDRARAILPEEYSKADATHSLNRAALITAAFASENYEALRGLFDDRIHQPYREKLLPQLSRVIRAGEKTGALGGFLSGAGSGIICLTLRNAQAVAQAMRGEWPDSETRILSADNSGLTIKKQ
jgi:homoserine kinase